MSEQARGVQAVLSGERSWSVVCADVMDGLAMIPDGSIHTVVTSPPYWSLRDYGVPGQLGLERDPAEFVANMVAVFREVKRVLRPDGTCWINLGDSYVAGPTGRQDGPIKRDRQHLKELGERMGCGGGNKYSADGDYQNSTNAMIAKGGRYRVDNMRKDTGRHFGHLKPKDLCMMPARVAMALQADGWWLRSQIVWHKPNAMPESCTDRPTTAHEFIYLLTKFSRYYYDAQAIAEPAGENTHSKGPEYHEMPKLVEAGNGIRQNDSWTAATWGKVSERNKRTVWTVPTYSFPGSHFATFPPKLIEPCVLAGCPAMCCPECGSGWRRVVERSGGAIGRDWLEEYPGRRLGVGKNITDPAAKGGNGYKVETTGWQPTCRHPHTEADTVPGVVLDPFSGAATSGVVALRLGRRYVGIELNPDYVRMGNERIRDDCPMFNGLEVSA